MAAQVREEPPRVWEEAAVARGAPPRRREQEALDATARGVDGWCSFVVLFAMARVQEEAAVARGGGVAAVERGGGVRTDATMRGGS